MACLGDMFVSLVLLLLVVVVLVVLLLLVVYKSKSNCKPIRLDCVCLVGLVGSCVLCAPGSHFSYITRNGVGASM